MSKTAINDLQALIKKLQTEREAHVQAIADIDDAFKTLGLKVAKSKRGAKKATAKKLGKKAGKRKRRKFTMNAADSVLTFVKTAGKKGATGGDIAKHWKAEGRGAGCYNTIGTLVKEKKLKRQALKGHKRGSLYRVG